jgi:chromosome segregation ATPase
VIEQIMIFALGFLFAGLAALAFAPAFWRRANRLTRRRLEMQVPLSVQEILAERDQLRAEFAVEQRRIELRAAQMNLAHAADRSELGRRAAEISALKDSLAQRNQENRDYEQMLAELDSELSEASAELGALTKALYDAGGLYERKQGELIELTLAHEAMTILAEERLANHAAADARSVALELRLGDVSRMLLEAEKRFMERTAQANKLTDALALSNRNLEHSESNSSALQKKLEAEVSRSAQMAQELAALRQQRDEDQGKLRTLMAKASANEAALEEAGRRENKLRTQREQQVEKARAAKHALDEKYDRLQSEYAALQGALEAARRRGETPEGDLSPPRPARQKMSPGAATEEKAARQQDKETATVVRLPRIAAEPEVNGAASETSAEAEKPALRVVSPATPADAEAAEKREVRDHVVT